MMTEGEGEFLRHWPGAVTKDLRSIYDRLNRIESALIIILSSNIAVVISLFIFAWKIK